MYFKLQSRAKWLRRSSKISYNLWFIPRFQWNCIESCRCPTPPFQCWVCKIFQWFCGRDNIEMGGGEKKTKMSENEKKIEIDTVSQLFLHGIVDKSLAHSTLNFLLKLTMQLQKHIWISWVVEWIICLIWLSNFVPGITLFTQIILPLLVDKKYKCLSLTGS